VEGLSFYFEANKITEGGTKRAILLSVVGAETYAVIRSLCAPWKPGEVDFEEIVGIVKEHFSPKPHKTLARFKLRGFACKDRSNPSVRSLQNYEKQANTVSTG